MPHSAASAPWVTQVARSTDAPRFIFFDLGGVIALFDRNIAIRQISAAADISIDVVREFLCDTDLQHRHESGEVDQNEFYAAFCAATGTHCSLDKLLAAGNQMFTLNVRILPIIANLAMDTLDYTGPAVNEGSKGILVGVGPPKRNLPVDFAGPLPKGASDVQTYCAGCLAVSGPDYTRDPSYGQTLARDPAMSKWPLIFLVDDASIVANNVRFLWTTMTRFEPAADLHASAVNYHRHHPCFTPPVILDCRLKPGFPDELVADKRIAQRVTSRWSEYFPDGNVEGEEDMLGYSGFARMD